MVRSLAEESERCRRCGESGLVMVADEREREANADARAARLSASDGRGGFRR